MTVALAASATQVTSVIDFHDWLGLAAVGAVVSTVGALLGILLKEFFFARSLERWKQRQTLEQVYARYRAPLELATRELAYRLAEIVKHYPPVFLRSAVLDANPDRLLRNSIDDPYFQRYKLLSTIYRIAALLGWVELYRQETTNLDSGDSAHSRSLEAAVELIRCDFADGQLNNAPDPWEWRDAIIFREELRALGDAMLEVRGTTRTVVGYASFCAQINNPAQSTESFVLVFRSLSNLLFDLETDGQDFRRTRLRWLLVHTVRLMTLLQRTPPVQKLAEQSEKIYLELRREEAAMEEAKRTAR